MKTRLEYPNKLTCLSGMNLSQLITRVTLTGNVFASDFGY